jgi:hypothetical protein
MAQEGQRMTKEDNESISSMFSFDAYFSIILGFSVLESLTRSLRQKVGMKILLGRLCLMNLE